MGESAWNDHIRYLEDEMKKMSERAEKIEEMIPNVEEAQKKLALGKLVTQLRGEIKDLRKYLAVMRPE